MIRLFVIEDHPVIVTGLRNLFRPSRDGIEVAGSANCLEEAVRTAAPSGFDIIILDLWLGSSRPVDNVRTLRAEFPGKPIIVYTSEISSAWRRKMMAEGVQAYLNKTAERLKIKEAIEKVAAGGRDFPDILNPNNSGEEFVINEEELFFPTETQMELIKMLSRGLSLVEIAKARETSVINVSQIFHRLRSRFGAKSNPELIRIFFERGIL